MARPLRIHYPGAFYHVMNRGISHSLIFNDPTADRALFKQTLADAVRLWKIRVHAYSLMNNHYHLLIETPLANLSRAMRHVDGVYTQRFNRKYNRDGPLIRGRFKAILIQAETYFLELTRYIHLNGVRAKLYPSARVDFNCSHWDYLHPSAERLWLTRDRVLSYFAHDLEAFDRFVHQGVPDSLQTTLDRKRWPVILGTKDFIEGIRIRFLMSKKPIKDTPQIRQLHELHSMEPNKVLTVTLELFEKYCLEKRIPQDGLNVEGRWVLLTVLRNYSHLTYQEIANLVGCETYDAVEKFIKRNDFSDGGFFFFLKKYLEAEMSNVET